MAQTQMATKSKYPMKCPRCEKILKSKNDAYHHKLQFCISGFKSCSNCHRSFKFLYTLRKHTCHKGKSQHCPEPDCLFTAYHKSSIITHLELDHFEDRKVRKLVFDNEEDFETWKEQECVKTFSYFVRRYASVNDNHYYVCQFDKTKARNPYENCLSRMYVRKAEKVTVKYYPFHNHETTFKNTKRQPYSKSAMNYVKECLVLGIPPTNVKENLHAGRAEESENYIPRKEHFMNTKYIRNVRYSLQKNSKLCKNDASSLQTVENHLKEKETPTLKKHKKKVKNPNEDIILLNDKVFSVKSQESTQNPFIVQKVNNCCPMPDHCVFWCIDNCVNLCVHMYKCTCADKGICKHIYKVHSIYDSLTKESEKDLHSVSKNLNNESENDLQSVSKNLTESENDLHSVSNNLINESENNLHSASNDLTIEPEKDLHSVSNNLIKESENNLHSASNDLTIEPEKDLHSVSNNLINDSENDLHSASNDLTIEPEKDLHSVSNNLINESENNLHSASNDLTIEPEKDLANRNYIQINSNEHIRSIIKLEIKEMEEAVMNASVHKFSVIRHLINNIKTVSLACETNFQSPKSVDTTSSPNKKNMKRAIDKAVKNKLKGGKKIPRIEY